jgi:hypothetical protein
MLDGICRLCGGTASVPPTATADNPPVASSFVIGIVKSVRFSLIMPGTHSVRSL